MFIRDPALPVHKITHADRLGTTGKTAILPSLLENYSAHNKHGSTM